MRVLTASGVFVEVGFERYTSNPLSEVIVQQGYNSGVKIQ